MTTIRRPAVLVLLALLAFAGSGVASALDLNDVIRLKLAGVSEETIMQLVERERIAFNLSVDDIIDLKDAGATEWLIRELMATPEDYGGESYAYESAPDAYSYEVDPDWADVYDDDLYYRGYQSSSYLDPYDYSTVFVYNYYDPFAYYWYPWPRSYLYYSPFWWSRSGFYFAGHWQWDWWDPWGPCTRFWDTHYGWHDHFGPSLTRERSGRSWQKVDRDALRVRADRERATLNHAGLAAPRARVTERAAEQRTRLASLDRGRVRDGDSGTAIERSRYRSGTREGARISRGQPATSNRGTTTRGNSVERRSRTRSTDPRSRNIVPAPDSKDEPQTRPEYRKRDEPRTSRSSRQPAVSRESRSPSSQQSSSGRSVSPPSNSSGNSQSNRAPEPSRPSRRR